MPSRRVAIVRGPPGTASVLVAVLVAALVATIRAQPPPPDRSDSVEIVEDGLYLVRRASGNLAIRLTDAGVVLVDDLTEHQPDQVAELVATVTDEPIAFVLGTHHHGGDGAPSPAGRPEHIAHARARAVMVDAGLVTLPRLVFRRALTIVVGDAEVRAHHFGPGHTGGDAVFEFPDLRVIHAGHLVVDGTPFIDYATGGVSGGWIDTLGGILQLDFDRVIPGHGPVMTKTDVRTFRDKLVTLRARVAQLIDAGVPVEDLAARLYTADLEWPLSPGAPFVSRSLPGLYAEIAAVTRRPAPSGARR